MFRLSATSGFFFFFFLHKCNESTSATESNDFPISALVSMHFLIVVDLCSNPSNLVRSGVEEVGVCSLKNCLQLPVAYSSYKKGTMVLGSTRSAVVEVKGTRGGRASGEPGGRSGIVFSLNINVIAAEFISPCYCHCPHSN